MSTPIYVTAPGIRLPDAPPAPASVDETADLLRQLLDVQKEQLSLAKAAATAGDGMARWRGFLARWQTEFPDIGPAVKQVLPVIERVYLKMIQELADRLRGDEPDDLDSEFTLAEFLDRYGMRLSQLGTIMSQLAPIAEAAPPPPAADDKVSG
jgi:hypothetical protein